VYECTVKPGATLIQPGEVLLLIGLEPGTSELKIIRALRSK
jgi:hypothetical protein